MDLVTSVLRRKATPPVDDELELAPPVRLAHHVIELPDGHRIGVATAGHGVPFVIVHGFGVESLLYAQPLARLAALGFRVVAIDAGGHGETASIGLFPSLAEYVELLERAVDHLGIRRAVFAGHSMGGRLALEVAVADPERAIGVVLVDAIVGAPWERVRCVLRWSPPALAAFAAAFALDVVGTVPVVADTRQALKLGSRVGRSLEIHAMRPWTALAPGQAILRAPSSVAVLDRAAEAGVYVAAVHGDRDLLVPTAAARDAARRTGGDLVTVHGGTHSWLLRCPETFPAVVGALLDDRLGDERARVLQAAGLDPTTATSDEIDDACLAPGAVVRDLAGTGDSVTLATARRPPSLGWTIEPGGEPGGAQDGSARSTITGA